jgi:hypothetical protein
MLARNDQPNINNFNFGVNSVFNNPMVEIADITPILPDSFLLLDSEFFFLLDGTQFLLLGT